MSEKMVPGKSVHGKPFQEGGMWLRNDEFIPDSPKIKAMPWRLSCGGAEDDTPIYQGPIDENCTFCWLRIPHTAAAHNRKEK